MDSENKFVNSMHFFQWRIKIFTNAVYFWFLIGDDDMINEKKKRLQLQYAAKGRWVITNAGHFLIYLISGDSE